MRASGRSTLLTTRITGRRASSALRRTNRVCGSGPSLASTRSSTPSTIVSPRSTSPPKSAWPGVSTMFSLTPLWRTAVFLARIVMPFSRSRSIESMTRSLTSWFSRNAPDCHSIASTSVVFPWSTWATIATLRRSSRTTVWRLLGMTRLRLRGGRRHTARDEHDREREAAERHLGQARAERRAEPVAQQRPREPDEERGRQRVGADRVLDREDREADRVRADEVHREVGEEAARRGLVAREQKHRRDAVERRRGAEEAAEEARDRGGAGDRAPRRRRVDRPRDQCRGDHRHDAGGDLDVGRVDGVEDRDAEPQTRHRAADQQRDASWRGRPPEADRDGDPRDEREREVHRDDEAQGVSVEQQERRGDERVAEAGDAAEERRERDDDAAEDELHRRGSAGARQTRDVRAGLVVEPRRRAGGRVLVHAPGSCGRRDRDVAAGVAQHPLEQRLRPGLDAERAQRLEVAVARRARDEAAPAAERAHDDDAEPELVGERQDLALDLALVRVVGDLDRRYPPAAHDARKLAERRRAVVRRTDRDDGAAVAGVLEQRQALLPVNEVVDLVQVDATAVPAERALHLALGLGVVGRPDLRRDDRLGAPLAQPLAEHALGLAVHGGGVDEARAAVERLADDRLRFAFRLRAADVERLPRSHPDGRDGEAARRAERALLDGRRTRAHGRAATLAVPRRTGCGQAKRSPTAMASPGNSGEVSAEPSPSRLSPDWRTTVTERAAGSTSHSSRTPAWRYWRRFGPRSLARVEGESTSMTRSGTVSMAPGPIGGSRPAAHHATSGARKASPTRTRTSVRTRPARLSSDCQARMRCATSI